MSECDREASIVRRASAVRGCCPTGGGNKNTNEENDYVCRKRTVSMTKVSLKIKCQHTNPRTTPR